VNVEAVAVVQTDASNVSESKGSLELTNLPVAIATRSSGSTSAFSTLTAQPGVQIDNNNNIVVAGVGPSQISFTIDGISSVGPGSLGALAEMFPSFNYIEEIRITETLNPAEFGGVADITTVSKSVTNDFHGGVFEKCSEHRLQCRRHLQSHRRRRHDEQLRYLHRWTGHLPETPRLSLVRRASRRVSASRTHSR
jgi:hypothetical protein